MKSDKIRKYIKLAFPSPMDGANGTATARTVLLARTPREPWVQIAVYSQRIRKGGKGSIGLYLHAEDAAVIAAELGTIAGANVDAVAPDASADPREFWRGLPWQSAGDGVLEAHVNLHGIQFRAVAVLPMDPDADAPVLDALWEAHGLVGLAQVLVSDAGIEIPGQGGGWVVFLGPAS